MRKLLIPIITFLSFMLSATQGKSQTNLEITSINVINDQGHVRITWDYNGTDTIFIFRDELEVIQAMEKIYEITDPTVNTFTDISAEAHKNARAYRISENTFIESDIVSTYHLTYDYDSCVGEMNLNWEDLTAPFPTNDWTPEQFIVNIYEDGILRTENVSASTQNTTIHVLENTDYSIFIETRWQGLDSTSKSNPINKFTEMPASPEYINAITASVDENTIHLKFEIDPNSELETYKLLKSSSQNGDLDTLETINSSNSELTTIDADANPSTTINYYKLVSINECGNETTNSDIINNILLNAELNDFDVSLNWNSFKELSLTPANYDIYRAFENNSPELIGSFANHNDFNDNIEALENYTQFCYFVQAKETSNINNDYSQSNTTCVYLKPKIYIAEAFTPNDDGNNDLFQPIFSFIPSDFEFKIYNRWGNIIFETKDYSKPWNGKAANGESVPTGTYLYYFKIMTPNNQTVEERGNVLVIYP